MSIFGKIKDAIFGKAQAATPKPETQPGAERTASTAPMQPQPRQASRQQTEQVDVDEVLAGLATRKGEKLNYRTSIVDLMKLLGIDSSLANRKELASELGYTGELDGSAEMNIWLHKATMRELAANGGKVPAELLD